MAINWWDGLNERSLGNWKEGENNEAKAVAMISFVTSLPTVETVSLVSAEIGDSDILSHSSGNIGSALINMDSDKSMD